MSMAKFFLCVRSRLWAHVSWGHMLSVSQPFLSLDPLSFGKALTQDQTPVSKPSVIPIRVCGYGSHLTGYWATVTLSSSTAGSATFVHVTLN